MVWIQHELISDHSSWRNVALLFQAMFLVVCVTTQTTDNLSKKKATKSSWVLEQDFIKEVVHSRDQPNYVFIKDSVARLAFSGFLHAWNSNTKILGGQEKGPFIRFCYLCKITVSKVKCSWHKVRFTACSNKAFKGNQRCDRHRFISMHLAQSQNITRSLSFTEPIQLSKHGRQFSNPNLEM